MNCGDVAFEDALNIGDQILSFKFDISRRTEELLNAKDALIRFQRDVIEKYKAESIMLEEMIDCGGNFIDRMGEAEDVGEMVIRDEKVSERAIGNRHLSERGIEEWEMTEIAVEHGDATMRAIDTSKGEVKGYRPEGLLPTEEHKDREDDGMIITKMVVNKGVYVCGTGGLLARHSGRESIMYDTNTSKNVSNMVICVCNKSERLIATTKKDVLIYDLLEVAPLRVVRVPGVKRLHSNGSILHLILNNGSMKVLDLVDYSVKDVSVSGHDNIRDIHPTARFPVEALLTLKAKKRLYRAPRANDYKPGAIVKGVRGVKGVVGGLAVITVCYSDDTLWLLNKEYEVKDNVVFDCGIKFVEQLKNQLIVVVDRDNTVHTYKGLGDCHFIGCHTRAFEENITAIAVSGSQVHIAIDGRVLTYDHTLPAVREPEVLEEEGAQAITANSTTPKDGLTDSRSSCKILRTIATKVSEKKIYVCGTGGLLARHTGDENFVYETNTSDDVSDMIISQCNKSERLIATTRAGVLIYDTEQAAPLRVVRVLGIRRVESKETKIHIILNDGSMKTIELQNYAVRDVPIDGCADIRDFFPTSRFPSEALLTLKASELLYRASRHNNYKPGIIVAGVSGVRGVVSRSGDIYICYSKDTLWVLNKEFEVKYSVVFDRGIKFVEHQGQQRIVVVDRDNTVHIYKGLGDCQFGDSHKRVFEEDIAAVAINSSQVFIGVENQLMAFYYTPIGAQGLRTMMVLDGGGAA